MDCISSYFFPALWYFNFFTTSVMDFISSYFFPTLSYSLWAGVTTLLAQWVLKYQSYIKVCSRVGLVLCLTNRIRICRESYIKVNWLRILFPQRYLWIVFLLISFQLCDISLRAGVTTLSAHRVVLAAASAYFHAMFNGKSSLFFSSPAFSCGFVLLIF